jgi:hypothetical protein
VKFAVQIPACPHPQQFIPPRGAGFKPQILRLAQPASLNPS